MNEGSQPPKPRRLLRFSLRTLLLLMAVVACWFGWRLNELERERQALTSIQAAGGIVHVWDPGTRKKIDGLTPSPTTSLLNLIWGWGSQYPELIIEMDADAITPESTKHLQRLSSLRIFLFFTGTAGRTHREEFEQLRQKLPQAECYIG